MNPFRRTSRSRFGWPSRRGHAARPLCEILEGRALLSTLTIAQENQLAGTPQSQWDISGAGDSSIQGFASDISVNAGQAVSFKINDLQKAPYHLAIYRMGYYQGNGARLVTTIAAAQTLKQVQPSPLTDSSTGLIDCGNWAVSATWNVPASATSGIYFADVTRDDTGGKSQIVFIVRNDSSRSQILFQTSDSTWQAYNDWGGNSLYSGTAPAGRAYAVSYNRPFNTRADSPEDFVWNAEYPMVRWMEQNGFDVTYFTGVDADRYGALIKNHLVYMDVGHDEYWSGAQRANVEAALAAGVDLAFFSGNECFWKTRWSNSISASTTPNRTLVCYKETESNAPIDPLGPSTWTGTWRDPRFSPPGDGGRPENALTGTLFMVNGVRNDAITVPSTDASLRFWRNTSVAKLAPGATATLPTGTLGYEWDVDAANGFRPAGQFDLSSTTLNVSPDLLLDYGSTYGSGVATHSLTMHRAPSGALVFGAGTVQWSWGLDGHHDRGASTASKDMQQATVNLLADMGVQPATLVSGLVKATASTDYTAPVSVIAAPTSKTSLQAGSAVSITGTATDTGGGVVAGVEVSVDGGQSWLPASGKATWTFLWTPSASGTYTIKSRAVDDSDNLEAPSSGVTVSVSAQTGPISIWSPSNVPSVVTDTDNNATELGVKFRSDVAGTITGIRFYKGSANTGTHVGNLWSGSGTLLASVTFTNETASGWQQATFSNTVTITPNTTYVVSYHTNVGHYSDDVNYFISSGANNGPLHALANGVDGPDGVYAYGGASSFPTSSYQSTNYWVDVVFSTSANGPAVTSQTPAPGTSNVAASTTVTAAFNESIQSSTLTFTLKDSNGVAVPASVTYSDATHVATLTPTSALASGVTYTATVGGAKDQAGNGMAAPMTWSFTTAAASGPYSIWSSTATPAVTAANDPNPVEVGLKFRSDVAGTVTAIRFYKGAGNLGTHTGHLWTNTGTLLGSVTFTNETASGWQQANFSSPIAISANTTYVVSYFAPLGNYAENEYFFSTGADNPPLHALGDGVDGPDGVYVYSGASSFPTSSYHSTNYWVDVMFTPQGSGSAPTRSASVRSASVPAAGASGHANPAPGKGQAPGN